MAFDYDLEIVSELTPTQAARLLASELDLEWVTATRLRGAGTLITTGSTDALSQSTIEREFNFQPTLYTRFRPSGYDPEGEDKESYIVLARAVAMLLRYGLGDAVLLSNGENVLLQRTGGRLMLNEGWDEWLRPQLDAARIEYEVRRLRSPALEDHMPTTA